MTIQKFKSNDEDAIKKSSYEKTVKWERRPGVRKFWNSRKIIKIN